MSIASESIGAIAPAPLKSGRGWLSLRYALREMRGGLRGFYVFIACIALGVMAISGVGSLAASLGDGLAREGRNLLGGDVAFVLFQREATAPALARAAVARGHPARHGARRRRQARTGRDQGSRWRLSDARRAFARTGRAASRSSGRARWRFRRRCRSDAACAA